MIDLLIHQLEYAIKSSHCYGNLLWNIYVFHGRQQLNNISIYYHSKAIWLIFDSDETVCLTDPGKKHCRKLEFFFFYLNTCKSTISRTKPPAAMAATVIRDFVERRKDGKKKKKKRNSARTRDTSPSIWFFPDVIATLRTVHMSSYTWLCMRLIYLNSDPFYSMLLF